MAYKVIITDFARDQLDAIIDYVVYELRNEEAADRIIDDFETAIETLEISANAFAKCTEPPLAQHSYYKYHLEKHRYVLLYRISGKKVIIDRVYHELQDYQNLEG